MTSIGVQLSVGGSSVDEIITAALSFEEAGFESVWLGDHLIDYYDPSRPVPECFVTLGALVAATNRVRIGVLATSSIVRHPVVLAQAAGTLDAFSGGRFELGLGTGGVRGEFRALGVDFPRAPGRVHKLEQALRVLRALQAGGPVDGDMDGFVLREAWCRPPFEATRIIVASLGPRTARLAGRYADEVNTIDYASQYDAERVIGAARDTAERSGRTLSVSLLVPPAEEQEVGGGRHPHAGLSRAEALGAHRLIYRLVPPYPPPGAVLQAAGA
jgi:alkanesulfonate monooxygenase SsuD/methylene tetrahydromethanopterin reductase-like flavin-dependent oxidoreductase (luciferase family)